MLGHYFGEEVRGLTRKRIAAGWASAYWLRAGDYMQAHLVLIDQKQLCSAEQFQLLAGDRLF